MPNNSTLPNFQPLFTYTPQIWQNQVTTSNSARDGNVNTGVWTVIGSGANYGSRIETITLTMTGTSTAGNCRLFIDNSKAIPAYTNTGIRLFKEISISAISPSATTQTFNTEIVRTDGRPVAILNSGVIISATMEKAEPINVIMMGGDF